MGSSSRETKVPEPSTSTSTGTSTLSHSPTTATATAASFGEAADDRSPSGHAEVVESATQLVEYFRAACKPRPEWRLGTEHELIGVSTADQDFGDAIPYEGARGIKALFSNLEHRGWSPIIEGEHAIALERGDEQITLEPGGQFELAGRPVFDSLAFRDDVRAFLSDVMLASEPLEFAWLCVGFRPFQTLEQVPWMPKGRYGIMRDYLPRRGALAHEMMKRTATVQVNLDYSDESDARAKLRASFGFTSLLTAIYANSSIVDEKVSGYQSYRSRVWRDTDPDRCGIPAFVFEDGDIFEAYTRWALDIPMFFVHRGDYIAADGMTFRTFLESGFRGHRATLDDWTLHLSTLFPEARLKSYIEVRSCDAGTGPTMLALGPLVRGLLYDADARDAAESLTAALTFGQRIELIDAVARDGLRARLPGSGHLVGDLAEELVSIADAGLRRQAPSELPLLDPVREIVTTRRTQADIMIELWESSGGDRRRVVDEMVHTQMV